MSKPEWMYSSDGEGFGPFTEAQLKKLISTGLVRSADRVWKTGDTESQSVTTFTEPPPLPRRNQAAPPSRRKGVWVTSVLTGCLALTLGVVNELGLLFRELPAVADTTAAASTIGSDGEAPSSTVVSESERKPELPSRDGHPAAGSAEAGMAENESQTPKTSTEQLSNPWPEDAIEYNGHRYKFYTEYMSWKLAKVRCEKMGGNLVAIQSLGENVRVEALILEAGWEESWIGATDEAHEGSWKWVTGDIVDRGFTNWHGTQPNNKRNVEHYMVMWAIRDGQWVDQPNYSHQHKRGFVCEWVVGKGRN